jgi:hypothetical protein
MKIVADSFYHQVDKMHDFADTNINMRYAKAEEHGSITFIIKTLPSTLTRDTIYNLSITISPEEIDALYRFSLKMPIPVPLPSKGEPTAPLITRRL